MTARVRFYSDRAGSEKQKELYGQLLPGGRDSFAIVTFTDAGVGLHLSIDEAHELGLSDEELLKAAKKPQEYQITLTPIKKEVPCGAQN